MLNKRISGLLILILILSACASEPPKNQHSLFDPHAPDRSYLNPPSPLQDPNLPLHSNSTAAEGNASLPRANSKRVTLVVGGNGITSFALVGILKRLKLEGVHIEAIYTTGLPTVFSLAFGKLKTVHDVEWFASRIPEKDLTNAKKVSEFTSKNLNAVELQDLRTSVTISVNNSESYDKGSIEYPVQRTLEHSWNDGFPFLLSPGSPSEQTLYIDLYGDACEGANKKENFCKNLATIHKTLKDQKAMVLKVRVKETSPTLFKRKAILKGFQDVGVFAKKIRVVRVP